MSSIPVGQTLSLIIEAHQGQRDLAGRDYVTHHLQRVAVAAVDLTLEFKKVPASFQDVYIAALLHDIVEDTPTTIDELRCMGYSEVICNAVETITKRKGEEYGAYIDRIKSNDLAAMIKLADIMVNLDIRELPEDKKCELRLKRYRNAYRVLSDHLAERLVATNPSQLQAVGVAC